MTEHATDKSPTGIMRVINALSRTNSAFGHLTTTMNTVGTVWIVIMCVFVVADVITLEAFNFGIPGVKEFIQLSIPGIVFLQLTNTLREGRHVTSDMLMTPVRRKWPRLAGAIAAGFNLIGTALMSVIGIVMISKVEQAYVENFFRGTEGIFTLPEWPSMALVVLGSFAMAFQYLLFFLRDAAREIKKGLHGDVETPGGGSVV